MRTASIREARQNLTSLLQDVRRGREVAISDRGRPVAMLVPVQERRPFPDLKALRKRTRGRDVGLTQAVLDGRGAR
jgi:prevent-host-death family protein